MEKAMRNPTQLGICQYVVIVRVSALKLNDLFLKLCLIKMLNALCKLKVVAHINLNTTGYRLMKRYSVV